MMDWRVVDAGETWMHRGGCWESGIDSARLTDKVRLAMAIRIRKAMASMIDKPNREFRIGYFVWPYETFT